MTRKQSSSSTPTILTEPADTRRHDQPSAVCTSGETPLQSKDEIYPFLTPAMLIPRRGFFLMSPRNLVGNSIQFCDLVISKPRRL